MRSFVPRLATILLTASGCAFSHEAQVDTGTEDAFVDDVAMADESVRDVITVHDVIIEPDGSCPSGTTGCGASSCVDTTSDNSNCGRCGLVCAAPVNGAAMCVSGACASTCNTGYRSCGGACVMDSIMYCGPSCAPCQSVPNGTVACVAGVCTHTCDSGYSDNGASCVRTIPTACGNRMLDAIETCDDGNNNPGDGCSADCHMELGTQTDNCTPAPVPIRISDTGVHLYQGSTMLASNDVNGCSANGPDVAFLIRYALTVPYTFTVTATPTSAWDIVIQHGAACPTIDCVDGPGAGVAETYSIAEAAPIDSDLMIDGFHSYDRGDFVLEIDVR